MKIFSFTFHTWGFVSAPVHSGLSPSTVYILCQNLKPPLLASFFPFQETRLCCNYF